MVLAFIAILATIYYINLPRDPRLISSSASLLFTDYSQVDMLRVWYKSVNFGAKKSLDSPNW